MGKKCSKCKEIKSVKESSRDRSKTDGITSACRECNNTREKNVGQMVVILPRSKNKTPSTNMVHAAKSVTVLVLYK